MIAYGKLLKTMGFEVKGIKVQAKDNNDFERLYGIVEDHGLYGWSRSFEAGKSQNALILSELSLIHEGYDTWVRMAHALGILKVAEGKITMVKDFMQKTHDLLEELGY